MLTIGARNNRSPSLGAVTMNGAATINGDARSGGNVNMGNNARITGTPFRVGTLQKNASAVATPLPGPIQVFVCSKWQLANVTSPKQEIPIYVEVAAIPLAADGHGFEVANGPWFGDIVVPTAGVRYGSGSSGNASLEGHIWANFVDIEHGVVISPAPSPCPPTTTTTSTTTTTTTTTSTTTTTVPETTTTAESTTTTTEARTTTEASTTTLEPTTTSGTVAGEAAECACPCTTSTPDTAATEDVTDEGFELPATGSGGLKALVAVAATLVGAVLVALRPRRAA